MTKERWYTIVKPGVRNNLYPMTHREARAFRLAQMEPNDWSFKEVPLTTRRYSVAYDKDMGTHTDYGTHTDCGTFAIHARYRGEAREIAEKHCEENGYLFKSILCLDSYLKERGPIGIV